MDNLSSKNQQLYDTLTKKTVIIFLCIFISVFTSCSKDNSEPPTPNMARSSMPKGMDVKQMTIKRRPLKKHEAIMNEKVLQKTIILSVANSVNKGNLKYIGFDKSSKEIVFKQISNKSMSKWYNYSLKFSHSKYLISQPTTRKIEFLIGNSLFSSENRLFKIINGKAYYFRDNYSVHRRARQRVKKDKTIDYDARWNRILPLYPSDAHRDTISAHAISKDGKFIVTTVSDTLELDLKVWSVLTKKMICSYRAANNYKWIKVFRDGLVIKGSFIYAYSMHGYIAKINISSCRLQKKIVYTAKTFPNGYSPAIQIYKKNILVSVDKEIMKLNNEKLQRWKKFNAPIIDMESDKGKLYGLTQDATIYVIKGIDKRAVRLRAFILKGSRVRTIAVIGDLLIVTGKQNRFWIYNVKKQNFINRILIKS